MSPVAVLSESAVDEHFRIIGATAIQFTLAGLADQKESFTVQFGLGREHFLTTLLAVDSERGGLIVDCSGSADLNQRFATSLRNIFVARPGGIHIQFSSGPARAISFEGGPAFIVDLPQFIVRLQRRESFRIETPRVQPLPFYARLPDNSLLTLPVHDISVAGIGLIAGHDFGLSQGLALANCRFTLPEDHHDVFLQAAVRHITAVETRAGATQYRLGLQFTELPRAEENRLQRYIAHLELERHELS